MTARSIDLHIEELVLHGFSGADRYRIAGAVEGELTRLLVEQGPPVGLVRDGDRAELDAGAFSLPPLATPPAIGNQVARAVYSGLSR